VTTTILVAAGVMQTGVFVAGIVLAMRQIVYEQDPSVALGVAIGACGLLGGACLAVANGWLS